MSIDRGNGTYGTQTLNCVASANVEGNCEAHTPRKINAIMECRRDNTMLREVRGSETKKGY